MSQAKRRDDIDLFVDDLLARPERAEELKRMLRDRLGAPIPPFGRRPHLKVVSETANDPDSLWDNVPV
ncbi:hypothetical protein OEZ71_05130 [Defluviimonas sp. WL0050]|uniref:Uncharacterized protein n=1 Tax=Albidovulum litorale TaxID=2984134 RepID=A0ABT2ZKL5_9RHOB|nr:hypothetical protein [Defluviimonas sp. WL0050]MCV2871671.1 hypothetical protein [Defluviimonas sp. WL0050]